MKSNSIDTVLEVRLRHEPGTLARLATAIAEQGGLLCEIETLRIGDEQTLREITGHAPARRTLHGGHDLSGRGKR